MAFANSKLRLMLCAVNILHLKQLRFNTIPIISESYSIKQDSKFLSLWL